MLTFFSGLFLWFFTGVVVASIGCRNGLVHDYDGWGSACKASQLTKALAATAWPFVLLLLFAALLGQAVSVVEKINFPVTLRQQTLDKMNLESEEQ